MANVFSSNPIYLDTDTTVAGNTNWRGSSGGFTFTGKIGIRPTKIILTSNGTVVAGNVVVNEVFSNGTTGPVVFKAAVAAGFTAAEFDLVGSSAGWKDFIVTGLTATVTAMEIYYRV